MAFSSVFFIVDPFATIPAFLVMTAGDSEAKRARMARQAGWTCFLVLSVFAVAGSVIFRLFGISPPAFKIAGGLLLFLVALDMLQAKRSGTQEVSEERAEGLEKEEVGGVIEEATAEAGDSTPESKVNAGATAEAPVVEDGSAEQAATEAPAVAEVGTEAPAAAEVESDKVSAVAGEPGEPAGDVAKAESTEEASADGS